MTQPLDPDTALDVRLSAIIGRNRYATDPGPVLAELGVVAGDRADILAQTAGTWAGFHEQDAEVSVMVAALREVPGAEAWVQVGRDRRSIRQIPNI